jgi:hypothetical protein
MYNLCRCQSSRVWEAGRKRNPGSANLADPSTGAACTTCAGVGSAGTTAIKKPSLGEAGRNGNPVSSVNQGDPSTGAVCTTCTPANPATGTAGTNSAAGTTGTTAIRKPSSGEAGRVRNPSSANLADPSTGAACTTCTGIDKAVNPANGTAAGTVSTTGKIPIRKPSLGEAESIKNTGSVTQVDPSTKAACTNCTAADPATGTPVRESLGSSVTTPVKKPIVLIDPARIRRPGTLSTGSSSKSGSVDNTNCTTCTSNKTSSLDESRLKETHTVSDLVKDEADPSLIETIEEAVSERTLSRFNTTVVETVDHIHFNYDGRF